MSGGSYDYVSHKFEQAADTLRGRHAHQPHVVAFARLLDKIAAVMHDIEWADSGDTLWDEALDAQIRALLHPADELAVATEQAEQAFDALEGALLRARTR